VKPRVSLTECLKALVDAAGRVNRGDLGDAEALLLAHAVPPETAAISRVNATPHPEMRKVA
jgi:hypothetical protein